MALKEKIEKASYNLPENLYPDFKKLKEDLCKFADEFDNYFSSKNVIDAKMLTGKAVDDMYKKIKIDFVGRIAKEKDNYDNYFDGDEKPTANSRSRKEFNSLFEKLNSRFMQSTNLIDFFKDSAEEFRKKTYHCGGYPISDLIKFIYVAFLAICDELTLKAKFLIAKDEEYFNDKKNSNLFSRKVVRRLFPRLWGFYKNRQKYDKHTVEKVKGDVKIFPKGKPLPSEVKQALIGDCYLMASLIALAKTNPKAITDCFVQGLNKIENEDEINIRLFQYAGSYYENNNSSIIRYKWVPIIIAVNKKTVIMPKYIKGGALWPKLIEKAYAVYRKEHYSMNTELYKNLWGGTSYEALCAITGEQFRNEYVSSRDREEIISNIIDKLKKKTSLTCGFKKNFRIKDVKSKEKTLIYSEHAYAIVGIDESKKYIRIINPWKLGVNGGRKVKNSPKSQEGGHIAMSFDDFKKNVVDVSYTTGK